MPTISKTTNGTPRSSSSLYPKDSVFTVHEQDGVSPLRSDQRPNDQSFDIAVIELHDDGTYVDDRQLPAAVESIRKARASNANGAIVVLFIHGWHHDARWDPATGDGDTHFLGFRKVLRGLTLREAERYRPNPAGRRVVGIFLGWNGDPQGRWLNNTRWFTHLSFWDRYRTANQIGDAEHVPEVIQEIVAATKDPLKPPAVHSQAETPESPLILIGHSMGALLLQSAFLALLKSPGRPIARPASPVQDGRAVIERDGERVAFPDALIAINSAADSQIVKEIKAEFERQRLTKTIAAGNIRYSPPLLISLTSTADKDTGRTWRIAHLHKFWHKTDGHDSSLFTHVFDIDRTQVSCPPRGFVDFGQNWHCLRLPTPPQTPTPGIAIDLPVRERRGGDDQPDHNRYRLRPLVAMDRPQLAWVFQVPPEVIADHNDIFNSRSSSLVMALIQISGAVMSLAQDWQDSFELET